MRNKFNEKDELEGAQQTARTNGSVGFPGAEVVSISGFDQ
jgi:hypothetical protein